MATLKREKPWGEEEGIIRCSCGRPEVSDYMQSADWHWLLSGYFQRTAMKANTHKCSSNKPSKWHIALIKVISDQVQPLILHHSLQKTILFGLELFKKKKTKNKKHFPLFSFCGMIFCFGVLFFSQVTLTLFQNTHFWKQVAPQEMFLTLLFLVLFIYLFLLLFIVLICSTNSVGQKSVSRSFIHPFVSPNNTESKK